ncbi:transporter substrate-binding domain-containing protein [Nakamurella sp. YIM 132087]|uniref:Transporter substrate-binding domain-containing protein n=1 Tax=Nakamurella alba TaxID=2665158 RepID=A0A7K1FNF6_9ACTN|nr:ABC transporter substrate-binding protein [Nakamurella alba]MTD15701.1 transporter substrate-binding domain-containing protein [Nakamurella alba]
MSARHAVSTAVLGVAALALAACGSDPSPTAGSTTPAATSPAASSSAATSSAAPSSEAPSSSEAPTSGSAALPAECAPADLATQEAGTLTIATSEPAYEPWMVDNDPTNKKGYESAIAYAVAEKLGYTDDQVTWTRVAFNAAISPAPKAFDFDINQFSITDDRKQAVDFSSGYYDVTQAVVTVDSSPIAGATTVADLKSANLGAQIGTTSLTALQDQIAPDSDPQIFQTNDAAVQALKNGQVDGLVVDLPTAFYLANAELEGGKLVGQLPPTGEAAEQFGLLLEKDSPLTTCVSAAVDAIRADGTIDALATEWLADAGAPVLG